MSNSERNNNRRLIKNTLLLYVRMLFTMVVSLFTSRVVLQSLGVLDYGIYNVVGGIVALFGFINYTLTGATSRFLTYEIGQSNITKLKKTFSTSLSVHIIIALLFFVFAETIGLWFVYNKLNVPSERLEAALIVYQISIVNSLISIFQTPFTASIVSREDMSIYAYMSIFECVVKLAIAYVIFVVSWDKLISYSVLMAFFSFSLFLIYVNVCLRKYEECTLFPSFNSNILKPLLVYSGWDLYGNISAVARTYGITVVLNLFFGAIINAATGVASQVQNAVLGFVENFMTAAKPQIVKYYAAGCYNEMINLIFNSSKYSFLLLFFISYPLIIEADYILHIWLTTVPEFAIIFTQLSLMIGWNSALFRPVVFGIHSTGKIRNMSIINGTIILLVIPITYILFRNGYSPYWAYLINIILLVSVSIINLRLLHTLIPEFKICSFINIVIVDILKVVLPTLCITIPIMHFFNECFIRFVIIVFISSVCILSITCFSVVNQGEREKAISFIKNKINK